MKKFTRIICAVLAVLMLTALTACGNSSAKNDGEKDKLVMATNAYFPPYEFYEDGEVVGIDAEIMAAVAEKLGCDFEILDMEFDSILNSIESGKADVALAGMTVDEKRLKRVDFTDTYATSKQVIIVPKDSKIASADDLNNVKIGVQLMTTSDMYITGDIEKGVYTGSSVEQYSSSMEAIMALKQGKIDVVLVDQGPGEVFVEKNDDLKMLDTEYVTEEYAMALKKGNTELLDKINAIIKEMKENGELQKIIEKYIPKE